MSASGDRCHPRGTAPTRGVRVIPVLVNSAAAAAPARPGNVPEAPVPGHADGTQRKTAASAATAADAAPVRRGARWTAEDVIAAVARYGEDAAVIAQTVTGRAAGPHFRLAGGTGRNYPSFTVEADSARTAGFRWRAVLTLYVLAASYYYCTHLM